MQRRGNTVVIILIVVGVMGLIFMAILVALLLPAVQQAREAARRSSSKANLKQIGVATHNFHDTYRFLPIGENEITPNHNWLTRMLPHMEQSALYERVDFEKPWDDPYNKPNFAIVLRDYVNPGVDGEPMTADGYAVTHYEANSGLLDEEGALTFRNVDDGLSSTILGGEVNSNFRAWGDPAGHRDVSLGINKSPNGFGSPFRGGANVLMLDGSVSFLSENIDAETLRRLGDPRDGEDVYLP